MAHINTKLVLFTLALLNLFTHGMDHKFFNALNLSNFGDAKTMIMMGADVNGTVYFPNGAQFTLLEYFGAHSRWDQVDWLLKNGASHLLHKGFDLPLFAMFCIDHHLMALAPGSILTQMILSGADVTTIRDRTRSCLDGLLWRPEFSDEHLIAMAYMIHAGAPLNEPRSGYHALNSMLLSRCAPQVITEAVTYLLHKGARISEIIPGRGTIQLAKDYHPHLVPILASGTPPPLTPKLVIIERQLQKLKHKIP